MRHRVKGRKLGRKTEHRKAMTRNMVRSLFTYGRVTTTLHKAKEMRSPAERLITLAKKGGVKNIRRITSFVGDRQVAKKIVEDVAERFRERKGGYTRIVRLGGSRWEGEGHGRYAARRLGDNGQRVYFELVERKEREDEMLAAGRGFRARQEMAEKRAAKKKGEKEEKKKKKKKKK
ncbi:MAG: 50S ribosomal protein L17 [Planctomycetota bacterium]|jgi:large subunit ribosomal protein L17